MYILKNALVSILRNKGRNILIAIIIIVISASCAITLAIRESANKIVKAYEEKNPVTIEIGMNRDALVSSLRSGGKTQEEMINSFNEIKGLTEEEIISYGSSDYIKSYYYTFSLGVNAKDIKEATDSLVKETTETRTETDTKTRTFNPGEMIPGGPSNGKNNNGGSQTTTTRKTTTTKTEKIFNEKAQSGAFTLVGYNSYEDMKEFINGEYTIIDGEVNNNFEANYCVISEELANLNELAVGSTITIVDPKNTDNTYELIISGIYKENSDSSKDMSSMFSNSANKIITNSSFIKQILEKNSDLTSTITPIFYLNDKDDIDAFKEEIKEKGISEYYTLTDNKEELENATASIKNVKTFATTFLIITLIIGGVVLIVINMINIRERKYEIGVLRTIGMKKAKVSIQFMLELLMVCILSLGIGAGVGAASSVKVANNLLANEIQNANNEYEDISSNFGKNKSEDGNKMPESKKSNFKVVNVEKVDNINAVVNIKVLLELLGIGVGLTILSSLVSMIAISRFSPLTILKERS